MTPDVSICIATYRRPRGLARLLESLARQKLPDGLSFEIVVVDNDAATSEPGGPGPQAGLAAAASNVRWFAEPRRNIAHARNRALDVARGHWLAFIDDDEVAAEGWLAAFWERTLADEADGYIGPVAPRIESPVTTWITADRFYGRPRHASGTRIGFREFATSNAFIRRRLFEGQRFDPEWGETGGSDLELFERLRARGADFAWCDDAIVYESIPADRQNLRWLSQRAFRGGVGFTRLQRERGRARVFRIALRAVVATPVLLVATLLAGIAGRAVSARIWLRACTQAGHLWALAGRSYSEYGGLEARTSLE
jgi:succinoglycan biosynthesis protein ExoM